MSYSLKEINEQIRSDPQGFALRSDAVYTDKVKKPPRRSPPAGGNPTLSCCPAPPAPARPPPP